MALVIEKLTLEHLEKAYVPDTRDAYGLDSRKRRWELTEAYHRMSREAGGPDAVAAEGFPWADYGGHTKSSKHSARIRYDNDRAAVRLMRNRYAQEVSMFSGPRGEGKTFWATGVASMFYIIGYWVVSNVSLWFGHRMSDGSDLLGLLRSPHHTLWLVDEVHQAFNRFRQGSRYQRTALGAVAALRKQQSALIGVTSMEHELGYDLKGLTKWIFYPYKLANRRKLTNIPPWMKIRTARIGPWPEDWRGSRLADKRHLPQLRREKEETRLQQPKPWDWWLYVPALYASFQEVPAPEKSGGTLMAKHINEIDLDRTVHLPDTLVFDGEDEEETANVQGQIALTVEDFTMRLVLDLAQYLDQNPIPDSTIPVGQAILFANAVANRREDPPYDQGTATNHLMMMASAKGSKNRVSVESVYQAANVYQWGG